MKEPMQRSHLSMQYLRPGGVYIRRIFGCKELVGVEIGVHVGANAKCMMDNLRIKRFYLIDAYTDISYEIAPSVLGDGTETRIRDGADRMRPFGDKIIWIRDFSVNAAPLVTEPLDFVYIDGDHAYESVKQDINLWWPKIIKGGVLCGHDYRCSEIGVEKAVTEFANENNLEVLEDYDDGQDWVIIK